MPSYYLGVDIGGTKSHALIVDGEGNAVGFGSAGPGNHESVGYNGLRETLRVVVNGALEMAGLSRQALSAAGFGVAGYDWPSEREPTLEAIDTLGLHVPLEAVNDTIIGLLAGTSHGWGIAVVAGTGTNCWGWDQHQRIGRVTGVGFGERGGAGDLVYQALSAIAAEWTLRGPKTLLTDKFLHLTGAKDIPDLIEGLELGKYEISSDHAPLVYQVASQGDEVARALIEWAGRELGYTAQAVIRQLSIQKLDFEVILVGSLYQMGEMLIDPMRKVIHSEAPGARLITLAVPPVVGGVFLAMEQVGIDPYLLRQEIIKSTKRLLDEKAIQVTTRAGKAFGKSE